MTSFCVMTWMPWELPAPIPGRWKSDITRGGTLLYVLRKRVDLLHSIATARSTKGNGVQHCGKMEERIWVHIGYEIVLNGEGKPQTGGRV